MRIDAERVLGFKFLRWVRKFIVVAHGSVVAEKRRNREQFASLRFIPAHDLSKGCDQLIGQRVS